MNKNRIHSPLNWLAAAVLLAAPGAGAWAQGSTAPSGTTPSSNSATSTAATPNASTASLQAAGRDVRASRLIGKDVRNAQGQSLGRIEDLIVDVAHDRVAYAVMSFGGFMGVGDKLFAYPVSSFTQASASSDELVLRVDKESLKRAPGFSPDRWPNWGDDTYREQIDRYFGSSSGGAPEVLAGQRLVRATQLLDKDIQDRNGREAGEIEDLVVNLGSSRVRYVVVDFDKPWSPDDKLLALPMKALTVPTQTDEDLVLNTDSSRLSTMRSFDEDRWPDLNAPAWRRDVDSAIGIPQTDAPVSDPGTR